MCVPQSLGGEREQKTMSDQPNSTAGDDTGNKRMVTIEIDRPTKKAVVAKAVEETIASTAVPSFSLVLEYELYDVDTDDCISQSISVDDIITQGIGLFETRAATECYKGDQDERDYTLKLIDPTKGVKANEVARLNFVWWADTSQAHLMGFNEHSQDLANFCRSLWPAVGRNSEEYNGLDIEMGDSPHSEVEVNELIAEALDCGYETLEITYLEDVGRDHRPIPKEHGMRLMTGLLALVGKTSNLITHEIDLQQLQMGSSETLRCGLTSLQRHASDGWYVRAADPED